MPTPSKPDLQEVLTSFAVTVDKGDAKALRDWISLYPQFERELTELAAQPDPEMESLPALPGEEERVEAGMARLGAILERFPAPPVEGEAIAGLFEEATKRGYAPQAFAKKVGLPMALMAKLDQRHFRFASISEDVRSALSHALGVSTQAIAAFLNGPPRLAAGVAFKSKVPPKMPEQVDFAEAFAKDPDVTEADRKRWAGLV